MEEFAMTTSVTREDALSLLKKYNKEPFHLLYGRRRYEMVCEGNGLCGRRRVLGAYGAAS